MSDLGSENVNGRPYHAIGDVLLLLQSEFPDITISKIRFLESQGLLTPERTPSGFRKFYEQDISRLRWILEQQRDNFLPLKVIKERLKNNSLDDIPINKVTKKKSKAKKPSGGTKLDLRPAGDPIFNEEFKDMDVVSESMHFKNEEELNDEMSSFESSTENISESNVNNGNGEVSNEFEEPGGTLEAESGFENLLSKVLGAKTTNETDAPGNDQGTSPGNSPATSPGNSPGNSPDGVSASNITRLSPVSDSKGLVNQDNVSINVETPLISSVGGTTSPDNVGVEESGHSLSQSSKNGSIEVDSVLEVEKSSSSVSKSTNEEPQWVKDHAALRKSNDEVDSSDMGVTTSDRVSKRSSELKEFIESNNKLLAQIDSLSTTGSVTKVNDSSSESIHAGGTKYEKDGRSSTNEANGGSVGVSEGSKNLVSQGNESKPQKRSKSPGPRVPHQGPLPSNAHELAAIVGCSVVDVEEMITYGFLQSEDFAGVKVYPDEAIEIATLINSFREQGLEPRHLKILIHSAMREANLFAQMLSPILKQRNPESKEVVKVKGKELTNLGARTHQLLVRRELRSQIGK